MTSDRPTTDPLTASFHRPTLTADPEPPTAADIATVRGAVLDLCTRAVRAGRADIAAELRAAVGPLVDAEAAARPERQALESTARPGDSSGWDGARAAAPLAVPGPARPAPGQRP